MGGIYTRTFYKGWRIYTSSIGSQNWVAEKHGVTMRSNTKKSLYTSIDLKEEDNMKLTKEDIQKYGTEEEKKILSENIKPGEFKILIETDNDAFMENPIDEIENVITDGIQSHLVDFMHNDIGTVKLIDSNGNSCGFIKWNFKRNW